MLIVHGANVDPLNETACPSAEDVRGPHLDHVRLVARLDPRSVAYALSLHEQGITVLPILARESFTDEQIEHEDYADQIELLKAAYWFCANWEVGNECDAVSGSSWTLSPEQYEQLFLAAHWTLTGCRLGIGGLSNGVPESWLPEVLQRLQAEGVSPDWVGIHPYDKTAEQARELLHDYQAVIRRAGLSIGLRVTEWNRPVAEIPAFVAMLAEFGGGTWYGWSDGQVDGMGLVTYTGEPKDEYRALKQALEGDTMPKEDYVIGPGFQARIDELHLVPLGSERYFAPDYSMVLTDKGPLWYSKPENVVVGPFADAP